MKLTSICAIVFLFSLIGTSCTDEVVDLAGTCVTCVTAAPDSGTIQACANGDGTITLTEDGVVTVTSTNDLATFQVTQEGTGSSCN